MEKKSAECVAFGEAVRQLRRDCRLSQDEFAVVADLHRTYVGGIERGERNPTLTTIYRIANALGVTPADLLARAREELE